VCLSNIWKNAWKIRKHAGHHWREDSIRSTSVMVANRNDFLIFANSFVQSLTNCDSTRTWILNCKLYVQPLYNYNTLLMFERDCIFLITENLVVFVQDSQTHIVRLSLKMRWSKLVSHGRYSFV
jgi:hypothetical protein